MPREQCPSNPYFYSWIKELRDSAKEKDNKSYHSYSRAMKALSQYPVPLRSGEEARSIQHIGDKIARHIDKKTVQFYMERRYRETEIEHFMISCALEKLPTVREKLKKEVLNKNRKRKKTSPPSTSPHSPDCKGAEVHRGITKKSRPETNDGAQASSSSAPSTVLQEFDVVLQQCEREMNPQASGSCAGKNTHNSNGNPQTKQRKRRDSSPVQQHAPSPPLSPGSLICIGSPPTRSPEKGRSPEPQRSPATRSQSSGGPVTIPSHLQQESRLPLVQIRWSPTPGCIILVDDTDDSTGLPEPPPSGEWHYCYLDDNNEETQSRGRAACLQNADLSSMWLKAKTYTSTLGKCDKLFVEGNDQELADDSCEDGRYKIVYIEKSYCDLRAPGLPLLRTQKKAVVAAARAGDEGGEINNDCTTRLDLQPETNKTKNKDKQKRESSNRKSLPDISDSEEECFDDHNWLDDERLTQIIKNGLKPPPNAPWIKETSVTSEPVTTKTTEVQPKKTDAPSTMKATTKLLQGTKAINVIHSVVSYAADPTSNGKRSLPKEPPVSKVTPVLYKLEPRTFTVTLCVDNAEVNSKKQQQLLQELAKNGVEYNVRKLQVGDFIWVARDSSDRELVLDVVVERKRMDDLAQSITGGRFVEQKLRLKSCGLSRRVYLVETKASYLSLPEASLNQAVVNTQVIDGFTIKKTQDIRETAAYLTILTRHLNKQYQDKELSGITDPECTTQNQLLTFHSFSKHSVKNRVFSVAEVWLKQLTRLPKISQDKAEAIVEVYPTPQHMMAALASLPNRDEIVSDIKFGFGRRKIGIAASRTVAGFFSNAPLH